jgi:hypothetical protein
MSLIPCLILFNIHPHAHDLLHAFPTSTQVRFKRFELLETGDGKAACVLQRSYRRRIARRKLFVRIEWCVCVLVSSVLLRYYLYRDVLY